MVRTADPHTTRSRVCPAARSRNARRVPSRCGADATRSGSSSRTSSSGLSTAAAASVSRASSQSLNGRADRSRVPADTTAAAARERMRSSSASGRPAPVWETLRRSLANCWMSIFLPTLRRPQTRPICAASAAHQRSSAASYSVLLTSLCMTPEQLTCQVTYNSGELQRPSGSCGAADRARRSAASRRAHAARRYARRPRG